MEPNTVFGNRLNQFDMRFGRLFRKDRYRFQVMLDVYNVFNAAAVLAYNTTFSTAATREWLHPTDVLQGRLYKLGGQSTFRQSGDLAIWRLRDLAIGLGDWAIRSRDHPMIQSPDSR